MKYAIITIGRSGSSELINILKDKIDIIPKPYNHLYPDELLKKFGENVKVIFITRNIKDVIKSVLQREKDYGINWIKKHYKNLNCEFKNYNKILEKDTLNFEKLYDSYIEQNIFDVLFIKYECLYFNHKQTINAICKFTKVKSFNISNNENNKWKGNYDKKHNINLKFNWDKSLQKKLDSYDFKFYLSNNILELRKCGFGSNINQVINSCALVEKNIIEPFYVIWPKNIYHNSDIFNKYFSQPFYENDNVVINKKYKKINRYVCGFITPRYPNLTDFVSSELLLPPNNRNNIKLIIDKYIKIHPKIKIISDKFINNFKNYHKIGIHCRGNGRFNTNVNNIFTEISKEKELNIINKVRDYIKTLDNKKYIIILFTDNTYSLNYFKKYFDNIQRYDSIIADNSFGEVHMSGKKNIKIFEDILIETEIMAEMDYLVHGNSNITNYVLSKNPSLKSYDIYQNLYKKPIKIAHLINPFKCSEDNPSYLYYAQPITFKSMRNSQIEAIKVGIDIKLYSVNYPEDDEIIPNYFIKLPHLKKSTLTEFPEISKNKKLPIIQEMFDSILQNTDADYIIFTNADIGVQKNFYKKIYSFIVKDNLESFIINRRNNIPKFINNLRLTENNLDIIYKEKGRKHPGKDCFIFKRDILEKINMGKMFTAHPPWGFTLHKLMNKINKNTHLFTDEFLTFHLGRDINHRNNLELFKKNKEIAEKLINNLPT